MTRYPSINVLGEALLDCSNDPVTGFYRTGCCDTAQEDLGMHTVCCQVTAEFLEFSKKTGNDLSTPRPEFGFPGVQPGDRWCVCAPRWKEALEATHVNTLDIVSLEDLKKHAATTETG